MKLRRPMSIIVLSGCSSTQLSVVGWVERVTGLTVPDVNWDPPLNSRAMTGWVFNFYFKMSD